MAKSALPTIPLSFLKAMALILATVLLTKLWSAEVRPKDTLYPNGKLKEHYTYYLDENNHEVRDGKAEEYFLSGAKKGEIQWQDGKENGLVTYFYPDGRKSYEATYKEGQKNGYVTVWYPTGQKQWQTVFRLGATHGVWREWYPDGKKKFEANYNDGKLEGLATWWHENGRIWQERSFLAGKLIKGTVREWNKLGKQTFPPPENSDSNALVPLEPSKQDSARIKAESKTGF
jgi:antitoxin component YwqK of YwqJK toxin-antitoxin module